MVNSLLFNASPQIFWFYIKNRNTFILGNTKEKIFLISQAIWLLYAYMCPMIGSSVKKMSKILEKKDCPIFWSSTLNIQTVLSKEDGPKFGSYTSVVGYLVIFDIYISTVPNFISYYRCLLSSTCNGFVLARSKVGFCGPLDINQSQKALPREQTLLVDCRLDQTRSSPFNVSCWATFRQIILTGTYTSFIVLMQGV